MSPHRLVVLWSLVLLRGKKWGDVTGSTPWGEAVSRLRDCDLLLLHYFHFLLPLSCSNFPCLLCGPHVLHAALPSDQHSGEHQDAGGGQVAAEQGA